MSSTEHLTNEYPTRGRKRGTTKASHCDSHSPFTCRESEHFLPAGLTGLLCMRRTEHQPPFLPPLSFVHQFLSHVATTLPLPAPNGVAHVSGSPIPPWRSLHGPPPPLPPSSSAKDDPSSTGTPPRLHPSAMPLAKEPSPAGIPFPRKVARVLPSTLLPRSHFQAQGKRPMQKQRKGWKERCCRALSPPRPVSPALPGKGGRDPFPSPSPPPAA